MSTLLDSLRRAKEAEAASSSAGGGRQVDAILSTLGYARRQRQARVFRTVGAGVVVGLVALLAWVIWDRTASMPEGPDVAADLTVDEAGVPVPAPTLEDAAEPVASPAPLSDPVREEVVDPVGNTIPRRRHPASKSRCRLLSEHPKLAQYPMSPRKKGRTIATRYPAAATKRSRVH